jgi:hypothetical protein
MSKPKKIPFGITLRGQREYTLSEVTNFIECADNIEPLDLQCKYIGFLEDFTSHKIKPSTLVDVDIMLLFQGDLDNRAQIDYREGHYCSVDDREIFNGGRYFDKMSKKLKAHIAKHI